MSIDAGAKGYSDVVKVLLDRGTDANAGDSEGRTVLKITLESAYTRVAESPERPARDIPRSQNLARFLCGSQDLISTIAALDLNFLACGPCEP